MLQVTKNQLAHIAIITVMIIASIYLLKRIFEADSKRELFELYEAQQRTIQDILIEQKEMNIQDHKRDSTLKTILEENNRLRAVQYQKINHRRDEKINRINSTAFNADSIRRAFAN